MTPEEDYQEALRRIHETEANKSLELNLSGLEFLTRFPPELDSLTSLRSLNLSKCRRLSGDLSPLAGLKSLQSLDFFGCSQLSGDLSARRPHLAPIALPLRVRAAPRLQPAGETHLAPKARPLFVRRRSPVFPPRIIATHAE